MAVFGKKLAEAACQVSGEHPAAANGWVWVEMRMAAYRPLSFGARLIIIGSCKINITFDSYREPVL
jgi:hypothetical protein